MVSQDGAYLFDPSAWKRLVCRARGCWQVEDFPYCGRCGADLYDETAGGFVDLNRTWFGPW